ncbi:MAG TPA: DUF3857 domain-containing protein [Nevskiaceae bacterium]
MESRKRFAAVASLALLLACAAPLARAEAAPAAAAVNYRIISQSIALDVHADGSYTRTVSRVVEPLTVAGVADVGHFEITYPANFAAVKVLAAYTETTDHRRLPVPPSQIFHQSTSAAVQAPFLSDGHVMSLLFPGVTPGAQVHLRYVETFTHAYLPGVYAVSEALAPQIPVATTDIRITAPHGTPLYFNARGAWQHARSSTADTETLTATASWQDVSFPPAGSADITQYAPMAVLSTVDGWTALAAAYDRLAKDSTALTPAIRSAARTAAAGASGEAAVANVYRWMQQNVQAVNVDYAHAGFAPPAPDATLARGIGDSNATVALLCAMLRAEGIDAVPAMVSESERFVPFPGVDPAAFDHFLAFVPAYGLFLDPSTRYAGVHELPTADQGRPVLITGTKARLARTPGPPTGQIDTHEVQELRLDANGDIAGHSVIRATGWRAMQLRRDVLGDRSGRRLQQFMENSFHLDGKAGSMQLVSVTNRDALDKPLGLTLRWLERGVAVPGAQTAFLLPSPGTINAMLAPFTDEATRTVPTVVRPVTIEEEVHLRLPAGATLEGLPANQTVNAPFGSYRIEYRNENGELDVEKRLQLTRFVITPQEYPALHRLAVAAVSANRRAVVVRDLAAQAK